LGDCEGEFNATNERWCRDAVGQYDSKDPINVVWREERALYIVNTFFCYTGTAWYLILIYLV